MRVGWYRKHNARLYEFSTGRRRPSPRPLVQGRPRKQSRDAAPFLPLPACGERSKSARATRGFRVRGRPKNNAVSKIQGTDNLSISYSARAEMPAHPEPELRSDSDLSPATERGRGSACLVPALPVRLAPQADEAPGLDPVAMQIVRPRSPARRVTLGSLAGASKARSPPLANSSGERLSQIRHGVKVACRLFGAPPALNFPRWLPAADGLCSRREIVSPLTGKPNLGAPLNIRQEV
jgi:hypothetical protein